MFQFIAMAGMAKMQMDQANVQARLTIESNRVQQMVNDINAESVELDAYKAMQHGYTQVSRYQSVIDKTIGTQKVIQAQSDVDISSGTAAEVREESRFIGYLNTLDIMQQARGKAKSLKMQAANIRMGSYMGGLQAGMDAYGIQTAGTLKAIDTGITGYAKWNPGSGGSGTGMSLNSGGGGTMSLNSGGGGAMSYMSAME